MDGSTVIVCWLCFTCKDGGCGYDNSANTANIVMINFCFMVLSPFIFCYVYFLSNLYHHNINCHIQLQRTLVVITSP